MMHRFLYNPFQDWLKAAPGSLYFPGVSFVKIFTTALRNLLLIATLFLFFTPGIRAETALKNPGIPESASIELSDRIDQPTGYVVAKVTISVHQENDQKLYLIHVTEGDLFSSRIKLDYDHLTTISEHRYDDKTGQLIESYLNNGDGIVHFFNKDKGIDKQFVNREKNIYSRYAYFLSFEGFPFEVGKSVTFTSYVSEYGDALPMKLSCVGKELVAVQAGTFDCYKLELSVAGWQSFFASDKYYLYYAVENPHQFIKYEEKDKNGEWYANELIRIIK
jgi:hypothetical protein